MGHAPRLEIDAPAILAEVASPAVTAVFAGLLADAAQDGTRAEELLPRLHELAATVTPDGQGAQHLAELAAKSQTLAGLSRAGAESALTTAALDLATSPLADLVTIWGLPATGGAPPLSVVCLNGISRADRLVRSHGDHFIERRVRLRYRIDQRYPLIELDTLSAHALDAAPVARAEWRQHPLDDYDLRIFSEQERLMGSVRTRLVEPPTSVEGAGLKLELSAPPGARLLATELLDEREQPLLRVLCWPAFLGG
jgi:hypothetical protein